MRQFFLRPTILFRKLIILSANIISASSYHPHGKFDVPIVRIFSVTHKKAAQTICQPMVATPDFSHFYARTRKSAEAPYNRLSQAGCSKCIVLPFVTDCHAQANKCRLVTRRNIFLFCLLILTIDSFMFICRASNRFHS